MASLASDTKDNEAKQGINAEVRASVLRESKAMNKTDGSEKAGDKVVTGDMSLAISAIEEMVASSKKEGEFKFDLRGVHLEVDCKRKDYERCLQSFSVVVAKGYGRETKNLQYIKGISTV